MFKIWWFWVTQLKFEAQDNDCGLYFYHGYMGMVKDDIDWGIACSVLISRCRFYRQWKPSSAVCYLLIDRQENFSLIYSLGVSKSFRKSPVYRCTAFSPKTFDLWSTCLFVPWYPQGIGLKTPLNMSKIHKYSSTL